MKMEDQILMLYYNSVFPLDSGSVNLVYTLIAEIILLV